jgi:hypothetical protein
VKARKPKTLMRRAKAAASEREVEKQIWTLFEAARDELRKMAREGLVDANAADEYHPVRTLIRIEHDPKVPPVIRAMAAKEILSYVEVPKAAQLKLDAGGNPDDLNITIQIAPWAADRQAARTSAAGAQAP